MSMLWQRVVTAVVLLALLVPALFATQPWPFDLLILLLIGAAEIDAALGAYARRDRRFGTIRPNEVVPEGR